MTIDPTLMHEAFRLLDDASQKKVVLTSIDIVGQTIFKNRERLAWLVRAEVTDGVLTGQQADMLVNGLLKALATLYADTKSQLETP